MGNEGNREGIIGVKMKVSESRFKEMRDFYDKSTSKMH